MVSSQFWHRKRHEKFQVKWLNNYRGMAQNALKSISELKEDCEILIRKDVIGNLVNYIVKEKDDRQVKIHEIYNGLLDLSQITSEITLIPDSRPRERSPKLFTDKPKTRKILIDEPAQASDDRKMSRDTVLSRTRKHLGHRNSAMQSAGIQSRNVKVQTDTCSTSHKFITAQPEDFLGLYEKGTNFPSGFVSGHTTTKSTQMYEHITPSELFCIEWIHKNLFEVKLNPNTLVVDDRLKDMSETACMTQ